MRTHRPFTDAAGFTHHCWECVNAAEWTTARVPVGRCLRYGIQVDKYDSPNNCTSVAARCFEYERRVKC